MCFKTFVTESAGFSLVIEISTSVEVGYPALARHAVVALVGIN